MANFNKIFLMGNLTRDPQLSYLPSQTAVVEFGLAVNRNWTGKDGQQKQEVCFVDCRAFGGTAENINKYLSKGRPLFVEGRLTFDSWTAQDGSKRSRHRVTVENFQFLGSSPRGGQNQAGTSGSADQGTGQADMPQGQDFNNAGADDIPF